MSDRILTNTYHKIMENAEFSLILPIYNQIDILHISIQKIINAFGNSCEIIIIDDGSNKDLDGVIERFKWNINYIKNQKNMGKGYSVKRGMLLAKGTYRIFTDADLPYGIEGLKNVLEKLQEGYDVVIGERKNPYPDKFLRRIGHKLFSFFIRNYLKTPFRDTQCGLKGFKASVAEEIFKNLSTKGFAFDLELLCLALMKNYSICTVDVKQSSLGFSTITIKSIFRMLADVRKIKKLCKR